MARTFYFVEHRTPSGWTRFKGYTTPRVALDVLAAYADRFRNGQPGDLRITFHTPDGLDVYAVR